MAGIITLQIGHAANYIGAHWWNLQRYECVSHEEQGVFVDPLVTYNVTRDAKVGRALSKENIYCAYDRAGPTTNLACLVLLELMK